MKVISKLMERYRQTMRNPVLNCKIYGIDVAILVAAVSLLLLIGSLYGSRYYTAWDDETLFTDIAKEYATHGILGAPSYQGNGLSMSEKTYFMPPIYPLTLSAWFQIRPATVESARLLSRLVAAGCLVIVYFLALYCGRSRLLAGVIVFGLAVDVQFAVMFNWARPDMLALTLSLLAILIYAKCGISASGANSLGLALALAISSTAMLTHPIGGMISFITVPLHLMLTSGHMLRKLKTWLLLLGIPVLALCLWGIYIASDIHAFKAQFIDWQSARKMSHYNGVMSYVQMLIDTATNYGVKGAGLFAGTSTVLAIILGLKACSETGQKRPALLLMLLTFISGLAVNYGQEMPYPPLRLPAFYLGLCYCATPFVSGMNLSKIALVRRSTLKLRYAPIFAFTLAIIVVKSSYSSVGLIREIRTSPRAETYDPATLAASILSNTVAGSSIGVRLVPDGHDILAESQHFLRVRKLSWHNLDMASLKNYVCVNDYLAITESALEPRNPGRLIDFTRVEWGAGEYREIALKFYRLEKVFELPGGATTKLYVRK